MNNHHNNQNRPQQNNQQPKPVQTSPQTENNAANESAKGETPRPIVSQAHDGDKPKNEIDDKVAPLKTDPQSNDMQAAAVNHANKAANEGHTPTYANDNVAKLAQQQTPAAPDSRDSFEKMIGHVLYQIVGENMSTPEAEKNMQDYFNNMNPIQRRQLQADHGRIEAVVARVRGAADFLSQHAHTFKQH